MITRRNFAALAIACIALTDCGEGKSTPENPSDFIDEGVSDAELSPLGWLGARTQPLTLPLEFEADGSRRTPGGLVVRDLVAGGPLADAGVQTGDVLVRVGDDWVPVKDDPTLEVVGLVEQAISSEQSELVLGCWRDGALESLTLALDRTALEVGLPVEVKRFADGAARACEQLVAQQSAQGGWSGSKDELATSALAALALRARWDGVDDAPAAVGSALSTAETRIAELAGAESASPFGLSLAAVLSAERLGRLPKEVILAARPSMMSFGGAIPGMPEGMTNGGAMSITIDDPAQLSELLESIDGEGSVMTFSVGGGSPPIDLPEGAVIQGLPEGAVSSGDLPPGFPPPGEKPDLAELLAQHDPARIEALAEVSTLVSRLAAMQDEDGGWAKGALDGDRLLSTSWALVAMGTAQRVGLELDTEVVEKGCAFLRPLAHEGKIAAAVARGADRREEAGRAAAVALAYHALGCADTEDFLRHLIEYSEQQGRHVLQAQEGVGLNLLALSVLRRMRGLPAWQSFFDEFRHVLVSQQLPDGRFAAWSGAAPCATEQSFAGSAADTALGALLLSMQSQRLEALIGEAENPFAPGLDGEGKRTDAPPPDRSALPADIPEGAQVITDPAEAQKLLEQLGIDLDNLPEGSIQIEKGGDGG